MQSISNKEQARRKAIIDNARDMILKQMPVEEQDETSLVSRYRDYFLQVSFSELHPLLVISLARTMAGHISAKKKALINQLNLKSILGSHAVNEAVGCYAYRATQWLDTELTPERYFEMLNRMVDEADRAYIKLAG